VVWYDPNREFAPFVEALIVDVDGNGLAATLPGEPGPELPMASTADLVGFLNAFPVAPGVAAMPWTDFVSSRL
jgi:hypothetical protein